jgi:hypothetical protein
MLEVAAAEKAPVVASAELLRAAGPGGSAVYFADMKVVDIRGRGQPLTLATWQSPA